MITNRSIQAALTDLARNKIFNLVGAGAPTSGANGTGTNAVFGMFAGPGSTYYDTTNNLLYVNIATSTTPVWQLSGINASSGNGPDNTLRTRFSTAQVNAGATILPAIAGWKYRVSDMTMIAIGGAATTNTSVRINATQAAGTVQLLDVAVAALTRSTVVRAGAANAAVLADGASFVANDVNTAILIANNGAGMTVATAIDVIINYSIEK